MTSCKVTERKKALVFSFLWVQLGSGLLTKAWHIPTPTARLAPSWLISVPVTGVQWQWFSKKPLYRASAAVAAADALCQEAKMQSTLLTESDKRQSPRKLVKMLWGWLWFKVDYRFGRDTDATAPLGGAKPAGGQVARDGYCILQIITVITLSIKGVVVEYPRSLQLRPWMRSLYLKLKDQRGSQWTRITVRLNK